MPTYQEVLARIAKAFDHHRIPYMVTGGQAVIRYGRPRLTDDIDITLGVDVTSLSTVQQAASEIPLHVRVKDVEGMVERTNVGLHLLVHSLTSIRTGSSSSRSRSTETV